MRKRIAFITVNVEKLYQTSLIEAMWRQSAALGYDFIVLTHFVNFDNETEHLKGDENIYTLIKQLSFDGAIIDLGSFYSRSLSKKLEDMLFERGIPVIALDYVSDRFESCLQNNREYFRQLTEHFIRTHGFKRIYCLSGPEKVIHSTERIAGYKDALIENGIPFRQDHVFYGDFWVNYAKSFAARIASGEIERPQAVVCGNDFMALQLCLSLAENGINVPDDIAIGGYDGNPDVSSYHPSLTTFGGGFRKNGIEAVCRLHKLISGESPRERTEVCPAVKIGASCGCKADTSGDAAISDKMFVRDMTMSIFMHSNYSSMMNNVKNMEECAIVLAQNVYLLYPKSDFFLCLCRGDEESTGSGYTDNMICRVKYCNGRCDIAPHEYELDSIIPNQELSDQPAAYILTPLHYLDRNFGYCVRRYSDSIVFEQYYGEFCQVAANTIERIRMLDYERYLNDKIQRLSERDILTGLFSRKGLISRTDSLSPDRCYYGVIYCIEGAEQLREQYGNEYVRQIIVSFAQAVNLSCARGELAARTGSEEFIMIGECDDSDFPEQLFINSLKSNLKMIEMQQSISISAMLRRLSAVTDSSTTPTDMIAQLEKKLVNMRSSSTESSAFLGKLHELQYNVYEEPQLEWTAKKAAAKIGISISYFQHLYRQFLNISFNADVISARLALAERLLVNTTLNISEIAEKCGYPDASHFMKLFRKKKGTTASDYRKTMTGNSA
jgi:DNA-binding LacI/PurR family transcriptional regulator/AraC-like DNA-binding protein